VGKREQRIATRELSATSVRATPEVERAEKRDAVFILSFEEEPLIAPSGAVVVRSYLRIDLVEDRAHRARELEVVPRSDDHDRCELARPQELDPHDCEVSCLRKCGESVPQLAGRQIVEQLLRRASPPPLNLASPLLKCCLRAPDCFLRRDAMRLRGPTEAYACVQDGAMTATTDEEHGKWQKEDRTRPRGHDSRQ
jgi:hypothetical protein